MTSKLAEFSSNVFLNVVMSLSFAASNNSEPEMIFSFVELSHFFVSAL